MLQGRQKRPLHSTFRARLAPACSGAQPSCPPLLAGHGGPRSAGALPALQSTCLLHSVLAAAAAPAAQVRLETPGQEYALEDGLVMVVGMADTGHKQVGRAGAEAGR